jgi:hypothetical protein
MRKINIQSEVLFSNKKAICALCAGCGIVKPINCFKRLKGTKTKYSFCNTCRKEERYIKELLCLKYYKVPTELILLKKAQLTLKRELCQQQ